MTNNQIKTKLIKHLTRSGKKNKAFRIYANILKQLHLDSKKSPMTITKLAILNATTEFKLCTFVRGKQRYKRIKEVPELMKTNKVRTSFALKFIVNGAHRLVEFNYFVERISSEIFLSAQNQDSFTLKLKEELEEKILPKRQLRTFFRW